MFQSFPLGDRSSVNLRGEYHVENVTTFEDLPVEEPQSHNEDSMEMDTEIENDNTATEEVAPADSATENISKIAFRQIEPSSKSVTFDNESKKEAVEPDMDTLYPIFWSLQANFAMPTRLFDEVNYQEFKSGLRLTMHKFQSIHQDLQARGTLKTVDDSKRGMKRKRGEGDSELSTSFNPKYLTSRDLFELEVRPRSRIWSLEKELTTFILGQRSCFSPTRSGPSVNFNRFPSFTYAKSQEKARRQDEQTSTIPLHPQRGRCTWTRMSCETSRRKALR